MRPVAHMRWIRSLALPWAAVIALGALLVFGEIGLARFGEWVSMRSDSGTPCGLMLCSCPTTALSRTLSMTPCGRGLLAADWPGHVCPLCGQDTAPAARPAFARVSGGHHPGLLLMVCACPFGLVLGRVRVPLSRPVRGRRFVRPSASRVDSRTLGVDPHPPKRA